MEKRLIALCVRVNTLPMIPAESETARALRAELETSRQLRRRAREMHCHVNKLVAANSVSSDFFPLSVPLRSTELKLKSGINVPPSPGPAAAGSALLARFSRAVRKCGLRATPFIPF